VKREKSICCVILLLNILNVVVLHFTFHFLRIHHVLGFKASNAHEDLDDAASNAHDDPNNAGTCIHDDSDYAASDANNDVEVADYGNYNKKNKQVAYNVNHTVDD
jgi:hypothetical protein